MIEATPSPFLRLFIAIAVPPEVKQPLARAQAQLRRATPPGAVRWTQPEQFHLTLKFLGDAPQAQLGDVEKSFSRICAGFSPLPLAAHGIGFFPGPHKPRVIWGGVEDAAGQLAELHRLLDEAMGAFAPRDRPGKFAGHITLGRSKPGHRMKLNELLARADHLSRQPFGAWTAEAAELVQCKLKSTGTGHFTLARCRLGLEIALADSSEFI